MIDDGHRDTWGAPSTGWPAFSPDGRVLHACPFCNPPYEATDSGDLARHIREECGQ